MRCDVQVLFCEPPSKKGYVRMVGKMLDSNNEPRLVTSFFHVSALPDVADGDFVDSLVYRQGFDYRFEPII